MSLENKPNIVFFFTDDQRFDTIAALGNPKIITPNIDRLVKNGTSFTHACIPSGTSPAVCMPSRAMLNTGRTLFHIEDSGKTVPADHTTIGEALRNNGYRTFGTGKWHNGSEAYARSFTDGGEIFFGGMHDHWNVPAFNFDPTGKYESELPQCVDMWSSKNLRYFPGDHINAGRHSSEMVCKAATDWINSYDSEQPFYTYISFLAPHDPRTMPEKFKKMYNPEDIDLPENFMGGHPFDNGGLFIRDEKLAPFPRNPENTKEHLADYYAMITHLDDELGKVIKAVEDKGVLDNTIFVFAGDNGLALGQHGLFGKQSCYDHSIRVPLIFAGPGVPKNLKSNADCYLLDIFPTLCELAGIETPKSVEGKSLTPVMEKPETQVRDGLFYAYCDTQRAVKKNGWKLIEYVINEKHYTTQLFNLNDDPWELHNLVDEQTEMRDELRKLLKKYAAEWDDNLENFGAKFWKHITF